MLAYCLYKFNSSLGNKRFPLPSTLILFVLTSITKERAGKIHFRKNTVIKYIRFAASWHPARDTATRVMQHENHIKKKDKNNKKKEKNEAKLKTK